MGNLSMYVFNVFAGSKDNMFKCQIQCSGVKSLESDQIDSQHCVSHIPLYIYYLCSGAHAKQPDLTDFIGYVSWRKVHTQLSTLFHVSCMVYIYFS